MADPLRIQGAGSPARPSAPARTPAGKGAFAQALENAEANALRFSSHAQKRLASRDIQLGEGHLNTLSQAVDKAAQRGSQDTLVLMDELAFVVNVRDRLVVTAVDSASRKEGVFTQIDSVVIANTKSS